ncbi:MAG: recombinase family protein [Dehalococcoidales bacterium]|nr:recombinase family protein [Dehalococcoidales bacterium]
MNLEDIIQNLRKERATPSEEDLRSLPYKKAFIYGRVSTQEQVRQSRESIMDIAKQVEVAIKDGYHTGLKVQDIEEWLKAIQNGEDVSKIIEDGDVTVNCKDLGLSGSLDEDKRPGLRDLRQGVESDHTGTVYLTEGMSRLSRDRDRVLGYKLLRLLKEHKCRIRTPEGVYNPAIPRDWENLADDIEDSAEEMKKFGVRLHRRRANKAAEGKHVGTPVCPGFIVKIEGQRSDGSYILDHWVLYPPHQEVVITALEEVVRQRSVFRAVKVLHAAGTVFPFFPDELKYMETRSLLRLYPRNNRGYVITTNTLMSLATNLNLTGTWEWGNIIRENNHQAIVPQDLFLQAYEVATSNKPRGKAAYAEPMEWAGLLYCCNHDLPKRVSSYNTRKRWACNQDSHLGLAPRCLYIEDHLLTPPLSTEFLRCLDLTPHAEGVLEKLKSEVSESSYEENRRRQRETELKAHITNLKRYLGSDNPEREETYWSLIKEAQNELQMIQQRPPARQSTVIDLERVRHFLDNLEENWVRYPSRLRNHLLKLLIDRVEMRHDRSHVECTIVWKMGLQQTVDIQRPQAHFKAENRWSAEETRLLRMLWPSASWEAILAALPERNKSAIYLRATRLRLSRRGIKKAPGKSTLWTQEEVDQLKDCYLIRGLSKIEIADRLGRTKGAIEHKISEMKLIRPKDLRRYKHQPVWQSGDFKVTDATCSQRHRPL